MNIRDSIYVVGLVLIIGAAALVWKMTASATDSFPRYSEDHPSFRVDPSWPKPLPATISSDGVAHRWVTGEIAGTCVDAQDNVVTFNRGWEVGVKVNGVRQGAMSGAIIRQDAYLSSIPSPPVVVYDRDGNVVSSWGNPALIQTGENAGGAAYLPHGAHGCFVDYQGNIWVAGNLDGVVQKYPAGGGGGVWTLQIGQKGACDGPPDNSKIGDDRVYPTCGEAHDFNSSKTLLNQPADVAVDPLPDPATGERGDVYIADGYGNHRIVVFDAKGNYVRQFGTKCATVGPTCGPGEFGANGGGHPHCVVLGNDGLVYTCDRPNSRIQVFDKLGKFVRSIPIGAPPGATPEMQKAIPLAELRACDIDFWPNVDYLAGTSTTSQRYIVDVDIGNDNSWIIERASGIIVGALGRCGLAPCPGHNTGEFAFGHTVTTDSQGAVYVAETIAGRRIQKFVPTVD